MVEFLPIKTSLRKDRRVDHAKWHSFQRESCDYTSSAKVIHAKESTLKPDWC